MHETSPAAYPVLGIVVRVGRVNVRGGQSVWKAARRVALTFESSALRYRKENTRKVNVGGSDGMPAKHCARLVAGSGSNPAPSALGLCRRWGG
jgi:hypothetical protein